MNDTDRKHFDNLPPEAAKIIKQCLAMEAREAALTDGVAKIGDPIDGADDAGIAPWVRWLKPDELWLARGCIARGVFVHINGNTVQISYGAKGRKTAKNRDQHAAALHFAQDLGLPVEATHGTKNLLVMLRRIAALRKAAAERGE